MTEINGRSKMEEACRIMAQSVAELYSVPLESKKRDIMVRALYMEDAVWSDPLTECTGLDSIVANFESLALAAATGKLDVEHASFKRDTGSGTLRFCGTANYRIRMTPFKLSIRQWSTLVFDNATGKIISHKDEWSVESMVSNIPLVGRVYNSVFRPSVGSLVNRVIGGYARMAAARAERKLLTAAGPDGLALEDGDDTASAGSTQDSSDEDTGPSAPRAGSLSSQSDDGGPKTYTEVKEALKTSLIRYMELKQRTSPVGSLAAYSPPRSSPPVGGGSSLQATPRKSPFSTPLSPPKGSGFDSPMSSMELSHADDEATRRAVPVPVLGARRLS